MVDRPTGPIRPWLEQRMRMPPGSLLGQGDIAELLGVTRQRVSQLVRDDPTFPRSGTGYGTIRFWRSVGVQAWAAMHRPQRPGASGRFVGEAAILLRAAEGLVLERRIGWLDATHVWWVVADGAGGPALARAVTSLGITTTEIDAILASMRGNGERSRRRCSMNPLLQTFLAAADRRAAEAGRDLVTAVDIVLAFVDAPRERLAGRRPFPREHVLALLEPRGLDLDELRRRIVAVEADPTVAQSFEDRALRRPPRKSSRRLLPGVDLAPNPLGHEPRTRHPWGSVFGRTRDDRSLVVDGEQWFFLTDGDGFFVRTADGRPIGYRWRLQPKPRTRPTAGFQEVLPMPPVELADWPDRRYGQDD